LNYRALPRVPRPLVYRGRTPGHRSAHTARSSRQQRWPASHQMDVSPGKRR
jgi:hypothetical protein